MSDTHQVLRINAIEPARLTNLPQITTSFTWVPKTDEIAEHLDGPRDRVVVSSLKHCLVSTRLDEQVGSRFRACVD